MISPARGVYAEKGRLIGETAPHNFYTTQRYIANSCVRSASISNPVYQTKISKSSYTP